MQGTRVRALVGEDPTCRGATGPVRHNYWACALEPASHNYWARVPQLLKKTKTKTFILVSLCTRARILCFQNLVFSRSAHPTLPHLLWRHHHQVPAGPAPASELWHSSCPDSSSMTLKLSVPSQSGSLLCLNHCCIYSQHHIAWFMIALHVPLPPSLSRFHGKGLIPKYF